MRARLVWVFVGSMLVACAGAIDSAEDDVVVEDGGADASPPEGIDAGESDAGGGPAGRDATTGSPGGDGGVDAGMDGGAADAGGGQTSPEGGSDAARGDASANTPDTGGGNQGDPVFVIAGYRAGIAYSRDLGMTWTTVHGPIGPFADNEEVLSGVAFGNGTFVAVGFKAFRSTDAEEWSGPYSPGGSQWLGNLNFGAGVFAGAGGSGHSAWTEDGMTWHKGTMLGTDAFDKSAFGDGTFMAASRGGVWWRSMDGKSWSQDSSGHSDKIVWCGDHFSDESACTTLVPSGQVAYGEGVWIRIDDYQPRRSTNGTSWATPDEVDFEATCVAFGYLP